VDRSTGVDGQTAVSFNPKPSSPITVKIGGSDGPCCMTGAAPTFVAGVVQISVKTPPGIRDGSAAEQIPKGESQGLATQLVAVSSDQ
jgi:uncharacterized protein (TIGR03437 family)